MRTSRPAFTAISLTLSALLSLHCSDGNGNGKTSLSSSSGSTSSGEVGGNGGSGGNGTGGMGTGGMGTGGMGTGGMGTGGMGTGGMGTGGMGTGGMGTGGMAMGGAGGMGGMGGAGGSGAGWPTHVLLDPTFGDNGMTLIHPFGTNGDMIRVTAHQADGKLILVGTTSAQVLEGGEGLLVRVNPNGTPDTSFGDGGRVTASFGPQHTDFGAAGVDPQGRIIVVAGADELSGKRLIVARYLADGTLDATFGTGGLTEPTALRVSGLLTAFWPDGSFVMYTTTTDPMYPKVLLKVRPNGTLDPAFGTGGIQVVTNVPFFGYDDISVQSDGKIWLLARTFGSSNGSVARFLANGARDTTFGATGEVPTPIDTLQAMVPAGNGSVYIGGFENLSGQSDGIIGRIAANGTIDTTFGNAGITRVSNPNYLNTIYRLSIDSTGRPLPTGYLNNQAVAMRFGMTGQLDTTFGNAGFATLAFWQALNQEVLADDSLVAVSRELPGGANNHIQTIRVKPGGAVDMAYGTNGVFAYASGATANVASKMLIEPDGKIVTMGTASPTTANLMLSRQLPDGKIDMTFGTAGVALPKGVPGPVADAVRSSTGNYFVMIAGAFAQLIHGFGPTGTTLAAFNNGSVLEQLPSGMFWSNWGLAIDAQDRIVSTAATNLNGFQDCRIRLKRLLPTGQVDTSFDMDGIVETDVTSHYECQPRAVVQLSDGKLLVGVAARVSVAMPMQSLILRYDASGALDTTFGNAGITTVPGSMALENLVVAADGKYVAAGHDGPAGAIARDMAVARLSAQGQADTTFGGGAGFVVIPTGSTAVSSGITFRGPGLVVDADGSMTLAGTKQVGSNMRMLIVRLLANGNLDAAYAMGGQGIQPELPGNFVAYALGRQPGGKLIAAGYGFWPTTGTDFAIVRLGL